MVVCLCHYHYKIEVNDQSEESNKCPSDNLALCTVQRQALVAKCEDEGTVKENLVGDVKFLVLWVNPRLLDKEEAKHADR